jgi:hypothetical protein
LRKLQPENEIEKLHRVLEEFTSRWTIASAAASGARCPVFGAGIWPSSICEAFFCATAARGVALLPLGADLRPSWPCDELQSGIARANNTAMQKARTITLSPQE